MKPSLTFQCYNYFDSSSNLQFLWSHWLHLWKWCMTSIFRFHGLLTSWGKSWQFPILFSLPLIFSATWQKHFTLFISTKWMWSVPNYFIHFLKTDSYSCFYLFSLAQFPVNYCSIPAISAFAFHLHKFK